MTKVPRCDYCTLPAVCLGSDMADPKFRCPRCCRKHKQFGGPHGREGYLATHEAAEGVSVHA